MMVLEAAFVACFARRDRTPVMTVVVYWALIGILLVITGVAVLGKVCRPEDIAAAILGFITGSDLVTGQTLVVDGGMLLA